MNRTSRHACGLLLVDRPSPGNNASALLQQTSHDIGGVKMYLGEHLQRASGLDTDLVVVILERVDEWLEARPLSQDPQLPPRPLTGTSAGMAGQRLQQRGNGSGPHSP